MKVLHLIYTNGIAGAEKYLMHLLPPLKKQHGIECSLIMVCAPGSENTLTSYCQAMEEEGIHTQLIVTPKRGFYKAARTINQYMNANGIVHLHSHLLKSDILATMVKIFFNKNVIVVSTKHGYNESILTDIISTGTLKNNVRTIFYNRISGAIVKKADYNYAVSKAIADLYVQLGLTKSRMHFIHHGVTVQPQEANGVDNITRFAEQQLVVVGRLAEVKGHQYILHAMPAILKKFPHCKLVILGQGTEKINLETLCNKLGIESNVLFLGFKSNPYSYVNNSDVIILPSLFEPFGLVYIEAFALKTPVVAFDTPAGNEIMVNGQTALLSPARDQEALTEHIIYLLENPDEAHKLAERAYNAYLDNFTTSRMVKDTAMYYRSITTPSNFAVVS